MDLTLAPGQTFERTWSNEGFYWNAWHRQSEYAIEDERKARRENFPEYFANGAMSYSLDPREPSFRKVVRGLEDLAIGAAQNPPCRPSQFGRAGHFVLPIDSAYVITDLAISGVFHRSSRDDETCVTYSVDGGKTYLPLIRVDGVGDAVSATASAPVLRGMYHLLVKFGFQSAGNAPCGLHSAEVRARLQNNPRSLPSLALNRNVISYQSGKQGGPCALTYAFAALLVAVAVQLVVS